MATFSYFQHYPHSLLDPLLFSTPNSSMKLSGSIDQNPLYSLPKTSIIVDTFLNPFLDSYNVEKTESSDVKKLSNPNTTAITGSFSGDQISQGTSTTSTVKNLRRKIRNGSKPKEGVQGRKCKKQRNGSLSDIKEKRASEQEAPKDYIHVRARRGQATDSHSLAERVRREKISERMRTLQNLVPGCDKVTGKALMLDEIINYVQSLQNQFLSMKLASISPVIFDFGSDLDGIVVRPEMGSTEVGTSFTNATTPLFSSRLDDPILTQAQLQEEGEEREKFLDRSGFNSNSFCSFS